MRLTLVTFAQLEAADQRLFQEVADRTRDGVQAGPLGRPHDDVFEEVCNLPEVPHLMRMADVHVARVTPRLRCS